MRLHNFASTKEKRRYLRNNMTESEEILWNSIKQDTLGVRFRRQFSIGHYILDFYCPRKKLAIEVDGEAHSDQKEYDEIRDKFMIDFDVKVLRFTNEEIKNNINQVLTEILKALALD